MMKRDLIVFEHERFELTGYDVWMTAGEIASLFGVTINSAASLHISHDLVRAVQTQQCNTPPTSYGL